MVGWRANWRCVFGMIGDRIVTQSTFQLPMTDPWCWYINANMTGVYWWDPWHTIYSTMDPFRVMYLWIPGKPTRKSMTNRLDTLQKNSLDMESSRKKIGFSILNFLNHPATAMTMEILMCSICLLKIKLDSISHRRKESTHLHMHPRGRIMMSWNDWNGNGSKHSHGIDGP